MSDFDIIYITKLQKNMLILFVVNKKCLKNWRYKRITVLVVETKRDRKYLHTFFPREPYNKIVGVSKVNAIYFEIPFDNIYI